MANDAVRARVIDLIDTLPEKTRVVIMEPKRTLDQNAKLWASLDDISEQVEYHGQTLPSEIWKLLFLNALDKETQMLPALDGDGFVSVGRSSSELGKSEMSDLLEIVNAWAANHGVVFKDRGY